MLELIKLSKEWKDKADKLLNEKGLFNDLSKFGQVYFTGAYSYNLMMHGDVDISVVRVQKYSAPEVFEILRSLYFQGKFRSYFIGGDWDDPRKGGEFPTGFYIGLKEKINDEKWKFDLWFMDESEFENRSKGNTRLKTLSDVQKELILQCKKYRNDNKILVTSQEIYNNVLGGEWKTFSDFEKYLSI